MYYYLAWGMGGFVLCRITSEPHNSTSRQGYVISLLIFMAMQCGMPLVPQIEGEFNIHFQWIKPVQEYCTANQSEHTIQFAWCVVFDRQYSSGHNQYFEMQSKIEITPTDSHQILRTHYMTYPYSTQSLDWID